MAVKPWTEAELEEIAQMRKAGHDDSYIVGSMKVSRRSNVIPPVRKRSHTVATKKKRVTKKASKKKVSKKKVSKKVSRKKGTRPGRKKGAFKLGDKITAVKGQDEHFYKGFPRYAAYELLCKKGSMQTDKFVDEVEKLEGVKSRTQALGILTKLVDKGCAKMSGKKAA